MKKGNNKGEWSEFYAFLKILEQRRLFAADKKLDIIDDKYFVFHKIIREEKDQDTKIYDLSQSDTRVFITDEGGRLLKEFDSRSLGEKTVRIFEKIKNEKLPSFSIPEAQKLMDELLCTKVKASNKRKADLVAIIFDRISKTSPMLGFSIKSMVGGASTLLNPGKTTNFIFEITNFNGKIADVNKIKTHAQIRDRVKYITEHGGKFNFIDVSNEQFSQNMKMIEIALPELIARMLLHFFSTGDRTLAELTNMLATNEEMMKKYGLSPSVYEYKIKNFLDAVALGMVPSKEWDGFSQAHGGYIVVKENGDVVCYHLYNRDEFRSYLYENTKFDAPSTTRYEYGKLYKENDKLFFKLNLQIRFLE
ncbi:MAG: HpaII family restriction endonuclease [Candidatus Magasanikbacteria bacterium CG10_big_fil_rev_8_21_14_0_10_40_10]|uniref:HpaII family restriction endonuclease n=1 Tax=Candidatus Magasanikbacteria bacterium CG10_big_fil_rev_8_21_14_0_10_40_10 TaxID=1974648 RepID=A0A2M6W3V3_9BACT|nr:MAG: HpaII family restriction endonuclease [Candidatus Magasanikbacteria bacterium CG10_big_fil_rev_8_21_14_0_10_40_10]